MDSSPQLASAHAELAPEQLPLAFGPPDFCDRSQDAFWGCVEVLETMPPDLRARELKRLESVFPVETNLLKPRLRPLQAARE